MKYLLFAESKVGYEAVKIMTEMNCDIVQVFIESEHTHEYEKYFDITTKVCQRSGIPYRLDAKQADILQFVSDCNTTIDYLLTFGYRKMIPDSVLEIANVAALGTHFSPLPRYRGFAPLNWVLINGEKRTAVNLFYLAEEVDSGDIIESIPVDIAYSDDINSLYQKCIVAFGTLMKSTIPKLESGRFQSKKQDHEKATYTCSRNPEDGHIHWENSSDTIYNLVRASTYPYPGAYTWADGKKLIIWSCEEFVTPKYEGKIAGKVIKIIPDKGIVVLCGKDSILLKEVQLEGGTRQTADKVIKSVRLTLH